MELCLKFCYVLIKLETPQLDNCELDIMGYIHYRQKNGTM